MASFSGAYSRGCLSNRRLAVAACALAAVGLASCTAPPAPASPCPAPQRTAEGLPAGAVQRIGSARLRHGADIMALAFLPDGHTLLAGDAFGWVRSWDVRTGAQTWAAEVSPSHVGALAVRPDGQMLAALGFGVKNALSLWNLDTRRVLAGLPEPPGQPTAVTFSLDGRRLFLACDDDGKSRIHVLEDGRLRLLADTLWENNWVRALTCSPDGGYLLAGGYGRPLEFRDAATGLLHREIGDRGEGYIVQIAVSPDGARIAIVTDSPCAAEVWDLASGRRLFAQPDLSDGFLFSHNRVAFSPDGRRLATVTASAEIHVWDTDTWTTGMILSGAHVQPPDSVIYSPDGRWLVSGDCVGLLRVWDARTGAPVHPDDSHALPVSATAFTPDGKFLLTAGDDATVRRWDLATGVEQTRVTIADCAKVRLAVSPDGRTFAVACDPPSEAKRVDCVRLFDMASFRERSSFGGADLVASACAFSPDGTVLAALCRRDGKAELRFRTTQTWREADIRPLDLPVESLVYSDHGRLIGIRHVLKERPEGRRLDPDRDGTISGLDMHSGEVLFSFDVPYHLDNAVLSPDGTLLATTEHHEAVTLWDVPSGRKAGKLNAGRGFPRAVSFSRDGRHLAATEAGTAVLIWDVKDARARAGEARGER